MTTTEAVVGVIQARVGSTRFPGKVLIDLGGYTMLDRVVRQLRAVSSIDEIVVATSDQPADDVIEQWSAEHEVVAFRGSEGDVLDRYYRAGLAAGAAHIVRVTADCPFLDHLGASEVVRRHLDTGVAYTHNITALGSGMPLGTGIEVFTAGAIERSWREGIEPHHREHVDEYIIENPKQFRTVMVPARESVHAPNLRLTVDVAEDVRVMRAIISALRDPTPPVRLDDIVQLVRAQPELVAANRAVVQKRI